MSGNHLIWDHHPHLDRPVLVAAFDGWNDAGDAATWAVRHLDQGCNAEGFAEIDPEDFFDFSEVRPIVELDGDTRQLHWPINAFSATAEPRSLIILQGIEPQLRWRSFTEQVLAVASECDASMIVTLGALLADVPHSRPVTVYGGSDDPAIQERLNLEKSTYEGPTGIVGVLNRMAQDAGIPTVSLWAAVPSYVSGTSSPKAALALLERLQDLLDIPLNAMDLEIASSSYERQISELMAEHAETSDHIRSLEQQYDDGVVADPDPTALVEEVEQFLREQPD